MAKKTKKSEDKISPDYLFNSPEETQQSAGYFGSPPPRQRADGSIEWRVFFVTSLDGKPKTETVSKELYPRLGLTLEMSHKEVRRALSVYNQVRKKELSKKIGLREIRARRRFEEMRKYNKAIFPPELVLNFINRLKLASDGKDRFKQRMIRCFEIVQEMTVKLNLLPHDYESNLDIFAFYFKEKKYSVSYCKDILWVLNKWGAYYSRENKTFFEPVGKLKVKTQSAISSSQKVKEGVRRESKPMTEELLKKMGEKIKEKPNVEVEKILKLNWLMITFYFGLRPSECDALLKLDEEEKKNAIEDKDGIDVLVAIQTKLTVVEDHEREKRIPVICPQQAEALEYIKKGQAKRPTPSWLNELLEDIKKPTDHYDLYSGRKGFTDFMLDKKIGLGQDLENISLYLGHKSVTTTWKTYKNRKKADFRPTDFTERVAKAKKETA